MRLEKKKITDLIPADYNPRKELKPGDAEFEKLTRSLTEFGYVEPVIWNKTTSHVVGGHQRLAVLKHLGHDEVDVVVVELDETREKALNIALNKISGEWDEIKLALLIQDLDAADFDVELTGFDDSEIADLYNLLEDEREVEDDEFDLASALEQAAFVKAGDVWTLGRHRLICADATNKADVETLMDGKKANLVVTDPPYNVAFESASGLKIKNDKQSDEAFYEFLLASFTNMAGVLEPGGSAYVFHADTEGLNFRHAFKQAGFHLSGTCIWVKNSLVLGRSPYQWQHEPVLFGFLKNGKHRWYADRKQTTIWNFNKPKKNAEHPTSKPLDLIAYPIQNSSAPNAIVLDLFAGSGSTLMACEATNRICYSMELDPTYASVILRRYVEVTGDAAGVCCQRGSYLDLVKEPTGSAVTKGGKNT